MKIAIVSGDDVIGDDPGRLCAALAAQGQDVTAYLRQRDRFPGNTRTDRGYRTVGIRVGPAIPRAEADLLPFVGDWAATLERLWSSDQPDVVHAYGWLGGLAAQLAARRQNLPTVQTFSPWPWRQVHDPPAAGAESPNANVSSRSWRGTRPG